MSDHGTNASYHRGCRCEACTDAARTYEDRRRREIAYGRWSPYVDAEPVRQHVRSLMAPKVGSSSGIGWMRIAEVAGVATSTVWKLLYGDPQRGQPPSRRCREQTAQRLLAVGPDAMAGGATVPAGPTKKRVAALVAAGFTRAELGRYITGNPDKRDLTLRGRLVTVATATKVEQFHDRWEAGEIIPRGRWNRHEYGPPAPFPATPAPPRCEDCGGEPWQGGRWCWDDYQAHRRAS